MKNIKIAISGLVILFSSCYTPNRLGHVLRYSIGQNTDYLRMQFGPPAYVLKNSAVGTVWVYCDTYVQTDPGYIGDYGYFYLYNPPTSFRYEASNKFWVDPNGRIFRYQSQGYTLSQPDGTATAIVMLMCFIPLIAFPLTLIQ